MVKVGPGALHLQGRFGEQVDRLATAHASWLAACAARMVNPRAIDRRRGQRIPAQDQCPSPGRWPASWPVAGLLAGGRPPGRWPGLRWHGRTGAAAGVAGGFPADRDRLGCACNRTGPVHGDSPHRGEHQHAGGAPRAGAVLLVGEGVVAVASMDGRVGSPVVGLFSPAGRSPDRSYPVGRAHPVPPAHLPTCPPAHLPTCPPAHLPRDGWPHTPGTPPGYPAVRLPAHSARPRRDSAALRP
jgi:hypothetical protein